MIVLRKEEVNLEKILERFEKETKGMYHQVELNSSNEDDNKLNTKDWKCLCKKVSEDYLTKNRNPDLVVINWINRIDRIWRTFGCYSDAYNLIK